MTDDIETKQGCCSGDSGVDVETEQGCCGDTSPGSGTRIETEQGCCSDGRARDEVPRDEIRDACCGDQPDGESACGSSTTDAPADSGTTTVPANRKSPYEFDRIRTAANYTVTMLEAMASAWKPQWTERDVAGFLHYHVDMSGLDTAWTRDYCPAVHAGADADVGHSLPGDQKLPAGELLHIDFGVAYEGYVADLQRVYYRPNDADQTVPVELQTAFDDVTNAIEVALGVLEPGVRGHEVDAVAREALTGRGWSAFDHAFGHQVGELAHDEGTLLGPRWDSYGENPTGIVHVDEVYSVELGVGTTYGFVGLEEMVVVREEGVEFVVEPQTELQLLGV